MPKTFTAADRRRLETLKKKERDAKAAEKRQKKADDKTCTRLFGMTADEIKEKLDRLDRIEKDSAHHEPIRKTATARPQISKPSGFRSGLPNNARPKPRFDDD